MSYPSIICEAVARNSYLRTIAANSAKQKLLQRPGRIVYKPMHNIRSNNSVKLDKLKLMPFQAIKITFCTFETDYFNTSKRVIDKFGL